MDINSCLKIEGNNLVRRARSALAGAVRGGEKREKGYVESGTK